MTTDDSPHSRDLVAEVVDAFERMPVPPPPAMPETMALLARAVGDAPAQQMPFPSQRAATGRFRGLSPRQRFAVGSLGVSTVVGLALLFVALNAGPRLSAMERMAKQLREIKSYSYTVGSETITTEQNPQRQTTWRESGKSFWHAPDAFRGDIKIVKIESTGAARVPVEEVLEDFVEIFPPGRMGIFIDHKRKTFFRSRFDPVGSTTYPLEPLKLIREDAPPPTRDLGIRQIGGKAARGFLVPLATGAPPRRHDWEVWLDPQTDLPLEISYEVDDRQQPRTTTVCRVSNFRWNLELDPKLFEPTEPEGYTEKAPPDADKDAP